MSEPVRVLEADLGLLNAQVEELSHAMNSSSSEVDQFREKFVDMAKAARQVHSDNERMKTRLNELENELITLRDANQQLKSELNEEKNKRDELLHSLIDSFNEIDTNTESNKMEEIQSDLNNLINILGHIKEDSETSSFERRLSEQIELSPNSIRRMRRILSEQMIVDLASNDPNKRSMKMSRSLNLSSSEHQHYDHLEEELTSLDYEEVENTQTADLNTPKLADSNPLMKNDFECQCNLLEEGEDETEWSKSRLIEANRELLSKLEAKSAEVRQLHDLVEQMEVSKNELLMEAAARSQQNSHRQQQSAKVVNLPPSIGIECELKNTESDSLQDLIVNYLSLIKSYKQLVEQLEQAKLDNSQLKISYNSLNKKYLRLKSSNDDDNKDMVIEEY